MPDVLFEVLAERDKLREVMEWVWETVWADVQDGYDLQTMLIERGLLVEVPVGGPNKPALLVLAWQAEAEDE